MACFTAFSLVASLTLLVSAGAPVHDAAAASSPAGSPTAAIRSLARAYADKSLEGYAALLASDYRFHFNSSSHLTMGAYVDGFTRDHELESTSALFNGVMREGRVVLAAARTITATFDSLEERPDPEHPDSTAHYRIVAAHRFRLSIGLGGGDSIAVTPALHVFHLVRGDIAALAEGQSADPERWYVRRWLEDIDGVTQGLAANRGDCGEPAPRPGTPARHEEGAAASSRSAAAPERLAIHPLGNPACPTLDLTCDLPGNEPALLEVFDVLGRRMNHRDLPAPRAGTVRIEAGAGARILPGVYWVRLSQGARRPTSKLIVVAR